MTPGAFKNTDGKQRAVWAQSGGRADRAVWAVDEVYVEEGTSTRQLFLVPHVAVGGEECGMGRIAYHITVFIQGRKYIANPDTISELDQA